LGRQKSELCFLLRATSNISKYLYPSITPFNDVNIKYYTLPNQFSIVCRHPVTLYRLRNSLMQKIDTGFCHVLLAHNPVSAASASVLLRNFVRQQLPQQRDKPIPTHKNLPYTRIPRRCGYLLGCEKLLNCSNTVFPKVTNILSGVKDTFNVSNKIKSFNTKWVLPIPHVLNIRKHSI
jgi:hypothetical protein